MITAYYDKVIPSPFYSDDIIIKVEVKRSVSDIKDVLEKIAYAVADTTNGYFHYVLNLTPELFALLKKYLGEDSLQIKSQEIAMRVSPEALDEGIEWELEIDWNEGF
jgi:DNA repair photolyase